MGSIRLLNSILLSEVWLRSATTRLVWITLLGMADRTGLVDLSWPGLARFAGVTTEEAMSSVADLLSHREGEEIALEDVPGVGWRIRDFDRFLGLDSDQRKRANAAARQRAFRQRRGVL